MIRFSRSYFIRFLLALSLPVLVAAVSPAQAQIKPFRVIGAGGAPEGLPLPGQSPRPHWEIGVATQLGLHCGEGTVQTDSAVIDLEHGVITGEFGSGSPFVFTGANGDQLVTWYGRVDHGASQPGTFTLTILDMLSDGSLVVEAAWIAEFVAQPDVSTGKFAGVTGSWIMYAYSAPFVLGSSDPAAYWWEGEGTLRFQRRR